MRSRFRPVTMQLAEGFTIQQSRPGAHFQPAVPPASSAGASSANGTWMAQLDWTGGRWVSCKQHTVNWFQFVLGLQVRAWT